MFRGERECAGQTAALQSQGEARRSHTGSAQTVSDWEESTPPAPPSLQPLLTSGLYTLTAQNVSAALCVCGFKGSAQRNGFTCISSLGWTKSLAFIYDVSTVTPANAIPAAYDL